MDHAQSPPDSNTWILCQIIGLMEIHNRGKFYEYTIYYCQVIKVQMFSHEQKRPFWGHFGWFLGHNFPKCNQILSKFGTVMQTIILHHIYYGFWNSIENSQKISPKTTFLRFFSTFLCHTLPRPKASPKIFSQMKGLMEIHNPGKFHCHSICGSQVIYL